MGKLHRTAAPSWSRAIGVAVLALGMAALAPVRAGASADRVAAPERTTATVQVAQVNLDFNPRELAVAVGDTVMWTNKETDATIHSVVQSGGTDINSPDIPPAGHFMYTFDHAAKYEFVCRFHPAMFMTVDVGGAKVVKEAKGKKLTKAQKKAAKKAADKAAKKAAAEEAANHDAHEESAKKSTPAPPPGEPESTIPGIGGLPFSPEPVAQRGAQK